MATTWTFLPQRDNPITERLEWLTDLLPSYNGKEQRIRLRGNPRRLFEFDCAAESDRARARLENALIAAQASVINLPIWPDASLLAADLATGAVTIPVPDTATRDYVSGGKAALMVGPAYELATISTVNTNSLTVSPLANAWPAGALVAPVRTARLADKLATSNPWPAVMQARMQFQAEAGWALTAATEATDYRGYPVLSPSGSWAIDGQTEFDRNLAIVDPAVGNRAVYDLSGVANTGRQYRAVLTSRAAIADFRAWLAARAGRKNPCWMASTQADLTITASIGSTDITISVANIGYADMAAIPVGHRDIQIQTVAGQRYFRRITAAATVNASVEQLTLDSALGVSLAPSAIARVSFLRLSRLAADAVEIAHYWDGAAESRFQMMSVRDDV